MSKVQKDQEDGCWRWTGTMNDRGRAIFHLQGTSMNASRAAYMMFVDDVPDWIEVCHRCDRGWCVNPAHLFLATHQENMADSMRKGRAKYARMIDMPELARLLCEGRMNQSELARHFGVSHTAISNAKKRLYRPALPNLRLRRFREISRRA